MNIKTLKAFTMRDSSTGALTSYAFGQIYAVGSTLGGQLITDGLAEEYTGAVAKPYGTKSITTNGSHDVTDYETAAVNVPNPSSGSLSVSANGTYDVTSKASVVVAVGPVTITYNANTGTGSVDPDVVGKGSSVTLDDGSGLTAPEGKEFSGWGTSADATEAVSSPYTANADVTLYAIWTDAEDAT